MTQNVAERRVAHPPAQATWFAFRLRSRFEFSVSAALEAAGIQEFLPTYVEQVRWADRLQSTTRPLFPGYLFAQCYPAQLAEVLQVRGVVQVLSLDGRACPIGDEVIADLRRAVDARATPSRCPYVPGEAVRIARGPFAGTEGVISRVKGATTLTIPVQILGRSVSVAIDVADVGSE